MSLVYEDEERQEEIPIEGAVIDLYKVADLKVSNGTAHYVLTKDFEPSGTSFEWMTASQSLKAARELDQLIEEKDISPTSPRTPTSSSEDSTSKGDTTRSTTTTTTSVRTGDTSPVELYTVMAVAALLIIILLMKKKA